MNKPCPECYSDEPRITPLRGPENCLRNHTQYVCATCGRCICADVGKGGKARWRFPFKNADIARLYIRAAEAIVDGPCEIYNFVSSNGRRFAKIFATVEERETYCLRNPEKRLESAKPAFVTPEYKSMQTGQRRMLDEAEVARYLAEKCDKEN